MTLRPPGKPRLRQNHASRKTYRFQIVLPTVWAATLAIMSWPPAYSAERTPNIVLVTADDFGWTDWQRDELVNVTGSFVHQTPNLLQLARAGVTFTQAYAASPLCSASRAALLTGRSPARMGFTDFLPGSTRQGSNVGPPNWVRNFQTAETTLAEVLREHGYRTGSFGKWHLGKTDSPGADPLLHGFDENVGGSHLGGLAWIDGPGSYFAGEDGAWDGLPGLDESGSFPAGYHLTDAITNRAEGFIQRASSEDTPFFLSVSYYGVHAPFEAPADVVSRYQERINNLRRLDTPVDQHDNAIYAAMVEKFDQTLGRLLGRLEDPNHDGDSSDSIRDNTIIVFTSDNGGLAGRAEGVPKNAPLRAGKGSLYEGGIRVPMVVSVTGHDEITPGSVRHTPVDGADLFPTLLDLADVPYTATPADVLDGVSLRPALRQDAFDRGALVWHYPHSSPQDFFNEHVTGGSFVSAIRRDNWKLLYFYDSDRHELYDLHEDIGETKNSLYDEPLVAWELSHALRDALIDRHAQFPVDLATGEDVLPAIAAVPGDFNGDGAYDQSDVSSLQTQILALNPDLSFDITGDGRVDEEDMSRWLINADLVTELTRGSIYDTNADGWVSPMDALLILNEIESRTLSDAETGELPLNSSFDALALDVTRDGFVSPLDALVVINNLGRSYGSGASLLLSVPEPAPAMPLALGTLLLITVILRRRDSETVGCRIASDACLRLRSFR